MKNDTKIAQQTIKQILSNLKLLEASIEEKTTYLMAQYMSRREKINEAFERDPHHNNQLVNRI